MIGCLRHTIPDDHADHCQQQDIRSTNNARVMILGTKNDPAQVSVKLPGGIVGTDVQRFLEFAGKAQGEVG